MLCRALRSTVPLAVARGNGRQPSRAGSFIRGLGSAQERPEQGGERRRLLEGGEVGGPSHHLEVGPGDLGGQVATAFLQVDQVEVAHHHQGRATDLGQAGPGIRRLGLMTGALGVQGDAVHLEGERPERPVDPAFRGMRPVEPEADLTQIEGVERPGVVGRGQGAIEDYFDHSIELEQNLQSKGKTEILADVMADLARPGEMSFVRQMQPLGLGHAVWCARDLIGDEPFAVMLPDMVMDATPAALAQLVRAHDQAGGNIIAVEPAPEGQAHRYGIVALGERQGRLAPMTGMVEKPAPGTEPSNLFISGRYILQPEIFAMLGDHQTGAGGEIQLTDAMVRLMQTQAFHALEYDGVTYDCGDKLGLLRANVALALKRPDLGADVRAMIEGLLKR